MCPACDQADETPEHVVFECPRFETKGREVMAEVGPGADADYIAASMYKRENTWNAVNGAVVTITKKLQEKWREEQSEVRGGA